jgi:hypothetical protein
MVAQKYFLLAAHSLRQRTPPRGFNVSDDLTEEACRDFLREKMSHAHSLDEMLHGNVDDVFNGFMKSFIELTEEIVKETTNSALLLEIPLPSVAVYHRDEAEERRESEEYARNTVESIETWWKEEEEREWVEKEWSEVPFEGPEPWNQMVSSGSWSDGKGEGEDIWATLMHPTDVDGPRKYIDEHFMV